MDFETTCSILQHIRPVAFVSPFFSWPILPSDTTRWVGAWWPAIIAASVLELLMAAPFLGFPRNMPGEFVGSTIAVIQFYHLDVQIITSDSQYTT